jgi:hypothetical protein
LSIRASYLLDGLPREDPNPRGTLRGARVQVVGFRVYGLRFWVR